MLHAKLVTHDTNECIEWAGARYSNGYGAVSLNRKLAERLGLPRVMLAHRASYIQNIGTIPDGEVVRHSCHNPACINPRHLSTGTQRENLEDSIVIGRIQSKLTEADVIAIKQSTGSQREVAQQFGISSTTVWAIRHGKKWRHINAKGSIQATACD